MFGDKVKTKKEDEKFFFRIVLILAFALLVACAAYSLGYREGYVETMNAYYEED